MSDAPRLVVRPGTVPPARSGNVAYLANLSHIFFDNREMTDELRATVHTLESYGGRLLPVLCLLWSGSRNLLALERPPLQPLQEYFGGGLQLALPRLFVFQPDSAPSPELVAAIRDTEHCHLDGFVTDDPVMRLAEQTGARLAGSLNGSRLGNDKLLLHRFLKSEGELVFEGIEASDPSEIPTAARELARRGYRHAVAKSCIGASGIGLVRFPTDQPAEIPRSHFHHGPCLVEGWLDDSVEGIRSVASPSVQMVVTEDCVYLYDLTDQILSSDSVHEGNVSPPESFDEPALEEELLRKAGVVGRWLHAQGYRGTASTDFHLAFHHSGAVDVRVCELNARVTGATYPSLLARRFLPQGTWLMRNLLLARPARPDRIIDDLEQAGLLFRPGDSEGVLPINFNSDDDALVCKGQFLFLGRNLKITHEMVERTLALQELRFTRD